MLSVDLSNALLNGWLGMYDSPPCKCGNEKLTLICEEYPDQWMYLYCTRCKARTPGAIDLETIIKQWNALQLIS